MPKWWAIFFSGCRDKLHNARTGFFEEREFREVLAKLSEHWRPPIEFGYYTGWRVRSEVLTLTWAQVDLEAKIVRLDPGTTKNREGRVFPFTTYPQLDEVLACQRAATHTLEKDRGSIIPWVFHRRGQRLMDYKHAWTKACVAAGHPGMLVHDLRRTAVRNLERACVPAPSPPNSQVTRPRLSTDGTRSPTNRISQRELPSWRSSTEQPRTGAHSGHSPPKEPARWRSLKHRNPFRDGASEVTGVGFEPTTYGLKVT